MRVIVTSKAAKDGGLWSGALLLLLVAVRYSCAEPCVDYIDIGHPERSRKYTTQPDDRYRCDYYVVETPGQWYRFIQYTGGRIPEKCVPLYKCGTVSPIWMNGTHPTEEGVDVEANACTNQGLGPSCCDWSSPMSVRMCRTDGSESFFVYQLPRPGGCSSSYCAGDKEPCREGAHWDEEGQMCSEDPVSPDGSAAPTAKYHTTYVPSSSISENKTVTPILGNQQVETTGENNNIAVTAGVAAGCVVFGASVAFVVFYCFCRKHGSKKSEDQDASPPLEETNYYSSIIFKDGLYDENKTTESTRNYESPADVYSGLEPINPFRDSDHKYAAIIPGTPNEDSQYMNTAISTL